MKKLLELRALKAQKIEDSKKLLAKATTENRSLNTGEDSQLTELRSGIESLNGQIATAELIEAEERSLISGAKGEEPTKPTNRELRNFVLTGQLENRSLSIGTVADGGYTVVPSLDKMITAQLRDSVTLMGLATNKTISGQTYEKIISVGGTTSGWASESQTRNETATSKLNKVSIGVNALYAYPKSTMELLGMADFDVESWLTEETSTQFAEDLNVALFNGDGTGKPKGILVQTRSASPSFGQIKEVSSAASAVIDLDDVRALKKALPKAYRKNASYIMNDNRAYSLQGIKDTTGRYIYLESVTAGEPDQLFGKPVHIDEQMPDDEILFGDIARGYTVVGHTSGTKMIKDMITAPGFVKMHNTSYFGGGVTDSKALVILKEKV
jgi:HK97 family phage major capsid protein